MPVNSCDRAVNGNDLEIAVDNFVQYARNFVHFLTQSYLIVVDDYF